LIRKNENEKQIKDIIKDIDRYLYNINIDKENVYDVLEVMSNIFKLLSDYDSKTIKQTVFKLFDSNKVLDRLAFLINTLSDNKFNTDLQKYFFDTRELKNKIIKFFEREYDLYNNEAILDLYYEFVKKIVATFIKIHMDFRIGKRFLKENDDMKIEVKDANGRIMVEVISSLNEQTHGQNLDEIVARAIESFATLYNSDMIKYRIKFIEKEK
jgi:hypothetical protein